MKRASIAFVLWAGFAAAAGPVVQTVELTGHRQRFDVAGPATARYLLIDPANADPAVNGFGPMVTSAVLMLFPGGDGRVFLGTGSVNVPSPNFLVRTRYHFAAEGFAVAVVDAANDFLAHQHPAGTDAMGFQHGSGLVGHRLPTELHGNLYRLDLEAVMADLRARFPGKPLWAVGTSRGTVSAAVAATTVAVPAEGLVLTASLTGPDPFGDLGEVALESIRAPSLIVTHKEDGCATTRPEDSLGLRHRFTGAQKVQVLQFEGGSAPLSGPCDPLDAHGFFGIEQKVVDAIARWIKAAVR